ncbi:MAG: CHAT domain-containing protein [Planctomycetia bacterium]|nr:CHAT domain-containing protein [Planctomycetia bacterium]
MIDDDLDSINKAFQEGSQHSSAARQCVEHFDEHLLAAEKFRDAAIKCSTLLIKTALDPIGDELRMLCDYYAYEAERSRAFWHYERHEAAESLHALQLAGICLDRHILVLREQLAATSEVPEHRLLSFLEKAEFYRHVVGVTEVAFRARESWDNSRFIDAFDLYREAIDKCARLAETARTRGDYAGHRILLGNQYGYVANACAAAAKHIDTTRQLHGPIPPEVACQLLQLYLDAFRATAVASTSNPERSQYRELISDCRSHIEGMLIDNKHEWRFLILQFNSDAELHKVMASLDPDVYFRIVNGAATTSGESMNSTMTVLLLASNPMDTAQLRLDEEARSIEEHVDRSDGRDLLKLKTSWAVRASDLQRELLKHKPTIVHFRAHGSATGELLLEDVNGQGMAITEEALAGLFKALQGQVRCVVLNACDSLKHARKLKKHVDFVIAMSSESDDDAAIAFSSHFYQAIGFGQSIARSFELGKNAVALVGIEGPKVPKLLVRAGADEKLPLINTVLQQADSPLPQLAALCDVTVQKWRRFDHLQFQVDKAQHFLAEFSESLFGFSERFASGLKPSDCNQLKAFAADLHKLANMIVQKPRLASIDTGNPIDGHEERRFKDEAEELIESVVTFAKRRA